MALVLQVVVTGLAAGAGYGLVSIAYVLIYRLTGVVHLALGELVGLAVLVTLLIAAGTGPVAQSSLSPGRYLVALAVGTLVSVACGVGVYLGAVRPFLKRGSMIGWVGAVVAVAFAVRGVVAASFFRQSYVFPDVIPFGRLPGGGVLNLGSGVTLQVRAFYVVVVGLALAALAAWMLERTRGGRALQAIAQDEEAARLLGIPVNRLLSLAFGLAGALAALAAIVQAPASPVSADTGALLGLKGLVAAVLAKFASPWKGFVAGLAVGVVEASVSSFHVGGVRLGPAYRDIVPLGIAIAAIALSRRSHPSADPE